MITATCPKCQGCGIEASDKLCAECDGTGVVSIPEQHEFRLPMWSLVISIIAMAFALGYALTH